MNTREYEEIKDKIKVLEKKKIKAEGSIEQIMRTLKDDFQINSIEEAQEKIGELETKIKRQKTRLEKMYDELNDLADWKSL